MTPVISELADEFSALLGTGAVTAAVAVPDAAVASGPVEVAPVAAPADPAAVPAATPGAPPAPVGPCTITEFKAKGYHLDVTTGADRVVACAEIMNRAGFAIDAVTGVDWMAAGQMEVVYDYFHPHAPWRVVVRTRIPREAAELPTVSTVFPGANWHERETHDFFGIKFVGHPDLTPLLLPEDATYHPLRKDFVA